MSSQTDWLRPLIEAQVQVVIAWARKLNGLQPSGIQSSRIKIEDIDDFLCSDDGSNFRTAIALNSLDIDPRVHILKVLSVQLDQATIAVGDGTTKIRAQLSADALLQLQTGIGESLTLDVTGDVFRVSRANIICTPYGLVDNHIRLEIQALEYLHHLRKMPVGQTAITERPTIVAALKEISSFRQQRFSQFAVDDDGNTDPQWPASSPLASNDVSLPIHDLRRGDRHEYSFATPQPKVTTSLNLDRPTAADLRETRAYHNVGDLHNLLTSRKTEHNENASTSNLARPRQSAKWESKHSKSLEVSTTSDKSMPPIMIGRILQGRVHKSSRNSRGELLVDADQQVLLDQQSSWRPSLPGMVFPRPNVPVKLLESWNTRADSRIDDDNGHDDDDDDDDDDDVPLSSCKPPDQLRNHLLDDVPIDVSTSSSEDGSADEAIRPLSRSNLEVSDLPPDSSFVPALSPPTREGYHVTAINEDETQTARKPASDDHAQDILRIVQRRPAFIAGRPDSVASRECGDLLRYKSLSTIGPNASPRVPYPRVTRTGAYHGTTRRYKYHGKQTPTMFSSFAQAFVESDPGGAFADVTTKKNSAPTIDVTAWDI